MWHLFLNRIKKSRGIFILPAVTLFFTVTHISSRLLDHVLPIEIDIGVPIAICAFYCYIFLYNIRITEKSINDFLTGLNNREFFFKNLKLLAEEGKEFHLLIIDLNKFKSVNDVLGHHVGDALLVEVSKRLKDVFRKEDIVARLGGDEFGVILTNPMPNNLLTLLLKRMLHATTSAPFDFEGKHIPIKFSLGAATFVRDAKTTDELSRKADAAMYFAKKENLGFFIFNESTYINPSDEARLISELKIALNDDLLEVVYQPKYSLKENKITSCEVLSRWNHRELGSIPPDKFVRLAEQEGLIDQLLRNLISKVFKDYEKLKNDNITFGINVSADNLSSMDIISDIMKGAKKHNVDLSKIILEVTETAIMKDPEEAIKYLVMLNSVGVKLSIDDFGTGNSSFIYLKHLPIHEIKIDRTFITDMLKENTDMMIIESTIHLAKSCNISIVAEGVEHVEQLEKLREYDCDFIQGYYIAKPMPFNNFVSFVKDYNANR